MPISKPENVHEHSHRVMRFEVVMDKRERVYVEITAEAALGLSSAEIEKDYPAHMKRAIERVKADPHSTITFAVLDKLKAGGRGNAELPIFLSELDFRSSSS